MPPGFTTTTSTAPGPWAGLLTTRYVALFERVVAGDVPKYTAMAEPRFVPLMVTVLPPPGQPVLGLRPVTEGAFVRLVVLGAVRLHR